MHLLAQELPPELAPFCRFRSALPALPAPHSGGKRDGAAACEEGETSSATSDEREGKGGEEEEEGGGVVAAEEEEEHKKGAAAAAEGEEGEGEGEGLYLVDLSALQFVMLNAAVDMSSRIRHAEALQPRPGPPIDPPALPLALALPLGPALALPLDPNQCARPKPTVLRHTDALLHKLVAREAGLRFAGTGLGCSAGTEPPCLRGPWLPRLAGAARAPAAPVHAAAEPEEAEAVAAAAAPRSYAFNSLTLRFHDGATRTAAIAHHLHWRLQAARSPPISRPRRRRASAARRSFRTPRAR